jgi:hypothetical protein
MALVREAALDGDFAKRQGGLAQELARQIDALLQQPLVRRLADAYGKGPREMARRQAAFPRDRTQGRAAVEIFIERLFGDPKLTRREPASRWSRQP